MKKGNMEQNIKNEGRRFSEPNMRDLAILEMVKSGDRRAFKAIHSKYSPHIKQYVYMRVHNPVMTEDIVQDIMLKVWSNIDKYRIEHTFNTWVWRIVRNHMVDHYRKMKTTALSTASNLGISCEDLDPDVSREQHVLFENSIADRGPGADAKINRGDVRSFIGGLLGSVSERERRILEMYFFDEMSYSDIAEELDVPLGTMKVLLRRAKEKIRSRTGAMETAKTLLA
jgi:RNA polymerase sigma-70 factor (ECF subfamily)